jgi:hypothetical protein
VSAREEVPRAVAAMMARVVEDGGQALAAYCEPVGGHWQVFCLLPLEKVAPTPYQRDHSPAHVKRLHEPILEHRSGWRLGVLALFMMGLRPGPPGPWAVRALRASTERG